MTSFQVRKKFIEFFKRENHTLLPSSSLIPQKDPSLLFVNAGMNQFKNVFLGESPPPAPQVVTIQKCLRAGGKHNDLENVGESPWHHTFFEMMGNFSFGSYFKETAIKLAWEFLTKELGFLEEHLYATVFKEDKKAYSIWREVIGLPEHKIFLLGEEDNFWRMGESGPCGPCSEIHYYKGPKKTPSSEELTTEIWNLVFMEFFEQEDGKKTPLPKRCIDTGMGLERLTSLIQEKKSNYDTDLFKEIIGTLEKFSGHSYNFNEDENTLSEKEGRSVFEKTKAFRVLADHSRAVAFLISDGVLPGNEGSSYVLRRILRRAFYYSRELNPKMNLLQKGTETLISLIRDIYPELKREAGLISSLIEAEEKQFCESLDFGRKIFVKKLKELPENTKTLHPSLVWDLYSTYGFPFDLTHLMAEKQGYQVNLQEAEKIKQKESASRNAPLKEEGVNKSLKEQIRKQAAQYHSQTDVFHPTEFTGYDKREEKGEILSLWSFDLKKQENIIPVTSLKKGQSGFVITDKTCFYSEGGGPLGDQGTMKTKTGQASIKDCQKVSKIIFHEVEILKGEIKISQETHLCVDRNYRQLVATSHSATHLLNFALRKVLGPSARQAGSLVEPGRLRFDFTTPAPLTLQQMDALEDIVNGIIKEGREVTSQEMPYKRAIQEGVISLPGENYDEEVRVIIMGDSKELCGGIHVSNTKEIKKFKIASETGVQSGVRRIVAYTGTRAKKWEELLKNQIKELQEYLKTEFDSLNKKDTNRNLDKASPRSTNIFTDWIKQKEGQIKFLEKQLQNSGSSKPYSQPNEKSINTSLPLNDKFLIKHNLELRRFLKISPPKEEEKNNPLLKAFRKRKERLDSLKKKCQSLSAFSVDKEALVKQAQFFNKKSRLLCAELPFENSKPLAALADQLKDKLVSGVVVALGKGQNQFPLIVAVTKDLQTQFSAGEIFKKSVAPFLKGKGGGQARFAQGIATDKKDFSKLKIFLLKELKKIPDAGRV